MTIISKKIILLFTFLFFNLIIFSQNKKIADSLELLLKSKTTYTEQVEILDKLSTFYFNINSDKALFYTNKQLELSQKNNYSYGIALSYSNLGRINFIKCDYKNSHSYCNKALQIFTQLNKTNKIAKVYNQLGDVYVNLNQNDSALIFYNQSKDLSLKINDNEQLGEAYSSIGQVYNYLSDYDK